MNSTTRRQVSRRAVLKSAAVAAPLIVAPSVLGLAGTTAPSNRIQMGFIGVGGHGAGYNMATFLQQDDCRVVAVCDVKGSNRKSAKAAVDKKYGSAECREFADFRELLAAPGIDAVCISTPDHWHVPLSMAALEAGKDVMCEKPTLTIAEGRALADLVAKKKAVYQVGLEDRSLVHYHKLAEWARNGAIGELKRMEVGLPGGQAPRKEEPVAPPPDLDWEMWLGPAPFHPYTPTRTAPMHWRMIRDYSGGMLTDWGAHIIDTAQVANFAEASGPVEVEGTGTIPEGSMVTMPPKFELTYKYANGVEMHVTSGAVHLKLIGTTGWVGNKGWRGRLESSDEKILQTRYEPAQSKLWPMPPGEHRNFLDCIRSRKPTTYTAEAGQRLSTALHIGNIAIELGRKLKWDPQAEAFVNDDQANALRSRTPRKWKGA